MTNCGKTPRKFNCAGFFSCSWFPAPMFRLQRFIGARHEESISHEFVRRKARDTRRNDGGTVNKLSNHQTLRRVPVLYQWYIVETGNDTRFD